MDRPRRQCKKTIKFEPNFKPSNTFWTVKNKEDLLAAIKRHGTADKEKLAKAMKRGKTAPEIETFISTFQQRQQSVSAAKSLMKADGKEAPLEVWKRLAAELVAQGSDYSNITSKVLAVCGTLEPHIPPRNAYKINYCMIYRYLAALLDGDRPLPRLNQMSTAILLDLLQGLADRLGTLDLGPQRHLMEEKYRLLTERASVSNKHHLESARRALENDMEVDVVGMSGELYPHNRTAPPDITPPKTARWNTARGFRNAAPKVVSLAATTSSIPSCSSQQRPTSPMSISGSNPFPNLLSSPGMSTLTQGGIQIPLLGKMQLKLPIGTNVSPGCYRVQADHLKQLVNNLQLAHAATTAGLQSDAQNPNTASSPLRLDATALQSKSSEGVAASISAQTQLIKNLIPAPGLAGVMLSLRQGQAQISNVQSESNMQRNSHMPSDANMQSNCHVKKDSNVQSDAHVQSGANVKSGSSMLGYQLGAQEIKVVPNNLGIDVNRSEPTHGVKRKHDSNTPILPKRTQLFSLNPLCIPVRFLRPRKKLQHQ